MNRALVAAFVLCGLAGSASAAMRPAQCKLVVNGKTYINGKCDYESDKDGSFRIFGKSYFDYVNVESPGKAEASWNRDPKIRHAHTTLGILTRKGACWVNEVAEICARELPPASRVRGR